MMPFERTMPERIINGYTEWVISNPQYWIISIIVFVLCMFLFRKDHDNPLAIIFSLLFGFAWFIAGPIVALIFIIKGVFKATQLIMRTMDERIPSK